jgi:hypothetical protein
MILNMILNYNVFLMTLIFTTMNKITLDYWFELIHLYFDFKPFQ